MVAIVISKWKITTNEGIWGKYNWINKNFSKFQEETGATEMKVKILLKELARVWEKVLI